MCLSLTGVDRTQIQPREAKSFFHSRWGCLRGLPLVPRLFMPLPPSLFEHFPCLCTHSLPSCSHHHLNHLHLRHSTTLSPASRPPHHLLTPLQNSGFKLLGAREIWSRAKGSTNCTKSNTMACFTEHII